MTKSKPKESKEPINETKKPIMNKNDAILKNKWFIFFKLLIPSLLLLSAIFALLASWRAGIALNTNDEAKIMPSAAMGSVPPWQNLSIIIFNNIVIWKNLSLWFGILSIIVVIIGFAINKNAIAVYSIMAICIIMIIIVLTFAFICIAQSTELINMLPSGIWGPPKP